MADAARPTPTPLSAAQRAALAGGVQSVAARLRLRAATLPLPPLPAGHGELLEAWLQSLPLPSEDAPGEPLSALGLTITGDLRHITWFAAGDPAQMIPPMATFLQSAGAGAAEMERLGAAGAAVEPALLGSFFESRADGANAGWFFPGRAPAALLAGQVDAPELSDALLRWLQDYPDAELLSLGRAMGAGAGGAGSGEDGGEDGGESGGEPYTRIALSLPQEQTHDLSQALPAALALFDALGAPPPPDAALAELQVQPPAALAVSFWLGRAGLYKAALTAFEPSLSLVIALAQEVGATAALDTLAALQALLDVQDAAAVELQVRADGYGIELMYELL